MKQRIRYFCLTLLVMVAGLTSAEDVKEISTVAQIGETKYETLAEAVAAAKSGDTIKLLVDLENTGNVSLPAGVTLDGDGKNITGTSAVYINKDGGTVQNVNFKNIHNETSKLSAIYGGNLAGTATITGCTFDNCDWDAIQITPVAGANVVITNNMFSDDVTDNVKQQRYIHVQSKQNVDFSATITEDVMPGKLTQEPIGVYYPTDKAKIDLTKNYIESINDVCILVADNNGYAGELVFPAYTTAEKQETYSPVAMIKNGNYAANFFATLQAAVDAAEAGATIDILKDFTLTTVTTSPSDKYNVNVNKSVTINGNGHVLTSAEGKRAIVLQGAGNNVVLKDITIKSNKAEACLWIADAVNVTLDNSTLDGTNGKTYNQPLTIGKFDSESRVALNVINGSVIKTNDAGTAHYDIIAWHPADITVTNSKLIGWAGVYLKPNAAGSVVKIDGSEMKSTGIKGTSNNFAVIVTECGNNEIEVKDTKISTTPAENTYQSLFTLGGSGNVVKFLGSSTYETTDMTYGAVTYSPGSLFNNKVYFDDATKEAFAKYFTAENGPSISDEKESPINLYPLTYSPEVYYYWFADGKEAGGYYNLADPFNNGWLDNEEFIRLMKDVHLKANLAWAKEKASFTMTFGDFKVTKGEYSIALKQGVTVNTDKQTDIFTAADADYKVVETAVEGGYTYTVVAKKYVAQIGEGENAVKYESLEEALAAISTVTTAKHDKSGLTINQYKANGTVSLLADCEGNGIVINSESNLTIDFAGHTYSVTGDLVGSNGTESQGFQLLKNSNVTFKSTAAVPGSITSAKATFLVQNYSNLTLENMNLDGSNLNGSGTYTLSNNNGNVVINNSTITAKEGTGNFAFDVCRYSSYPSVNVTVKGESVINGNIEVSATGSDAKDGFSLMLESCTLTGEIVLDATAKAAMAATPEKATVSKSNSLETIAAPEEYKWKDNGNNTSSLVQKTYVAKIGDVKYETLKEALGAAKDNEDIVVELLADATLDVTAWDGEKNALSIGSANTKTITINGNNHQLTFNNKNSDWNNIATMNDAETKLILNDIALTNSGYNNGPWNRHDINFNCAVELNNVTSDKALAFKNDASLKNVTVTETGDVYAIWVQPKGQNISIDGLTINAANGRGIKIDDQYVDNPEQVTLDIANATFNTKNKSAILVKSAANTVITAGEGINIENVASDKENLVWVDEDRAEEFYKVTVAGATVVPESKVSDYVACVMNGEQRWGFYKKLSDAVNNVEEGYSIKLHQTTTEAVEVSKQLTITKNGFTADNVTAGEGYKRFESETEIVIRSFNPICAIGDNKYETLAEAVAAAGTSEATITLLKEAATDGVISGAGVVVPSGSNITFDLNGLTYDVSGETVGSPRTETNGFQLLKNSNITFKNGTLKATSPTAQMLIQNYSNLTLEDVNLDGTTLSGWAYALSNNCGTINLNGSTSITAKAGGRAFDTCKFGSYAIPTVNVNTTGTISGPIEATGGKLNIENGKFDVKWVTDSHYAAGDIQIKGGVFSAEPAEEYIAEGCVVIENTDEATKADYPYAVKTKEDAGIFELVHGEPYPYPEGRKASKVTYRRSFGSDEVNHYRCWYVPFDYTIQEEDMNNFDFYKIHMIAGSGKTGGVVADNTQVYIYIEKVKDAGTVLRGNRPYVIRPKSAMTDHIFTANDITEIYPENNESRLHQETTEFEYDYYGTYREHQATGGYEFISLNKKDQTQWNATGKAKLQSYVWYIKVTSRDENIDYAKTNIFFVDIDDDTTDIFRHQVDSNDVEGVYTVSGAKVEKPVKGVNIIRYKNGTTKKIYVK